MKPQKLSYNELDIREEEKLAPPTSIDIIPIEKASQPDDKLSLYAIKLIRRLLKVADADFTDISIKDREWLEDVLTGTSLDTIARHHKLSHERIRQRVNMALDLLYQKIEAWDVSQNRLLELSQRVKQLDKVDAENQHLRSLLEKYSSYDENQQKITLVDEQMKQILHESLRKLDLPYHIYRRFNAHNIHSVMELIRYTDRQLCSMEGISHNAVEEVKRSLSSQGLQLGSEILWSPESKSYFIYPPTGLNQYNNAREKEVENGLRKDDILGFDKLSSYAIKLIRRLLKVADADFTDISIQDREWLEDVLKGKSINEIANHAKKSPNIIHHHVNNALELLYQNIVTWEHLKNRIQAKQTIQNNPTTQQLKEDLKQARKELKSQKSELTKLRNLKKEKVLMEHEISTLKASNEYLQERNRVLMETVASYKEKEKEIAGEESKKVKELKGEIKELQGLLKQLRKQGRIAIATLDFLND